MRTSEEGSSDSQDDSEKSSLWSQETQPLQLQEGDLMSLASEIWPAAAALAASVGSATLLFPFFTFVQSSGWLKSLLPQARKNLTSFCKLQLYALSIKIC